MKWIDLAQDRVGLAWTVSYTYVHTYLVVVCIHIYLYVYLFNELHLNIQFATHTECTHCRLSQSVNSAQGSNRCLMRETHKTQQCTVWARRTWEFEILGFNALPLKLSRVAVDMVRNMWTKCAGWMQFLQVTARGTCSFFLNIYCKGSMYRVFEDK